MRILLGITAMLGVLFCGIGTVHAVPGVADNVPGQDIVVPLICGNCGPDHICGDADDSSGLNTLIAIAEVGGPDKTSGASMHFDVRSRESRTEFSGWHAWTPWSVEAFDCKTLTQNVGSSMDVVVDGVHYNAGYVIFYQYSIPVSNRFISWVYFVDLAKGFAAGFNGLSMENGVGPGLEEDAGGVPVTASFFYPRYFINNNDPDSWTWWIFLAGTNQPGRTFSGNICNEEENCVDFGIAVPYELNVISVESIPALTAVWPDPTRQRKGFAVLTLFGAGNTEGYYSMFGWSYERATSVSLPITGNWDVVHPMHRMY